MDQTMIALCSKETKAKIELYISGWECKGYPQGIPDEAPENLERFLMVPSYRLICKAILKNDRQLLTLGYEREHCEMYSVIKREELKRSGKIKVVAIQYGLFGEDYECI